MRVYVTVWVSEVCVCELRGAVRDGRGRWGSSLRPEWIGACQTRPSRLTDFRPFIDRIDVIVASVLNSRDPDISTRFILRLSPQIHTKPLFLRIKGFPHVSLVNYFSNFIHDYFSHFEKNNFCGNKSCSEKNKNKETVKKMA